MNHQWCVVRVQVTAPACVLQIQVQGVLKCWQVPYAAAVKLKHAILSQLPNKHLRPKKTASACGSHQACTALLRGRAATRKCPTRPRYKFATKTLSGQELELSLAPFPQFVRSPAMQSAQPAGWTQQCYRCAPGQAWRAGPRHRVLGHHGRVAHACGNLRKARCSCRAASASEQLALQSFTATAG